ncbi:MAG: prolipoprotein diacylglyceryl transferase [Deltaproteobacteria bacterium]|nr:prolipoprotein diacylglyceryl transferase [Deltaproteobacteria bacterium]
MFPVIAKIGPLTLHTFGVTLAVAILVSSWFLTKEARRLGDPQITEEKLQRLVWYIVLAVVFGGRLMHVIVEYKDYLRRPLHIFAVWEGGLVMYGGLLATFFTVVMFARKNRMRVTRLCDLIAPAAFLGQSIGRWGCFFAGDDYGKRAAEGAWYAVRFTHPNSLVPMELRGVPLYPVQIFMSLKALTIFLVLLWITRRKKFDGQVAGWSFILYAMLRSVVELFRGDTDRGFVGPLSTAQFTSLFGFLLGVAILWFSPRRMLEDDLADAERAVQASAAAKRSRKGSAPTTI